MSFSEQPMLAIASSFDNGTVNPPKQQLTPRPLSDTIILRELNFGDFWNPNSSADCTATAQAFLLYARNIAKALAATNIANAVSWTRQYVLCTFPKGKYLIKDQLWVPEFCCMNTEGVFYTQPGGALAANNYLPAIIFSPYSHCKKLDLQCNYYIGNAQTQTSGVVFGKTWGVTAAAVATGGVGYAVNDTITLSNPSLYTNGSYASAVVHVTSVSSGVVTGLAIDSQGIYSEAPAWAAATLTQVSTSGKGTGCVITPTWTADFSGGDYQTGPFMFGNWEIGQVNVFGVGAGFDGTFGPQRAIWLNTGNAICDAITCDGGLYGVYYTGYDTTVRFLNTVLAFVGLYNNSNGLTCPNCVFDSTQQNVIVLQGARYSRLTGSAFWIEGNNAFGSPIQGSPGTAYVIKDAGGRLTFNCDLDFQNENIGNHPGNARALSMDYASNCRVRLRTSNLQQDGTTAPAALAAFAAFGSHNNNNCLVEGQFDGVTGSIFTGTAATWGMRVWDSSIPSGSGAGGLVPLLGGWAMTNNTYEIVASGAPVNGATGTGFGKAGPGSQYTDIATGKFYLNTNTMASPTWTAQA